MRFCRPFATKEKKSAIQEMKKCSYKVLENGIATAVQFKIYLEIFF